MPAPSYGEADNGKTYPVTPQSTFFVRLNENPTTGYSWNWTLTPGLELVNDSYAANESGLMGAGGVHTWELKLTGSDTQTFSAVYKRPFDPVFGNETTYSLNVTGAGANTMTPVTNATATYTEADNNQTVTVAKGTIIAVKLGSNPSTGYSWNTTATTGLTVKSLGHVTNPHPSGMVGVPGNDTWEITATGEGDQKFTGVFKQPWMPASASDKTFTLNIKIS